MFIIRILTMILYEFSFYWFVFLKNGRFNVNVTWKCRMGCIRWLIITRRTTALRGKRWRVVCPRFWLRVEIRNLLLSSNVSILINMRIFQLLNFKCQASSLKFLSLKFSQSGPFNFTTCNISLVLDNIKRCLRYKSNDLKVQKWFKKLILSKTNEIF